MFTRALFLYFLIFTFSFYAQEKKDGENVQDKKNNKSDSTQVKQRKKVESEFDLKNYKSDPNDRLIIEINHTGWLGLPANIAQNNLASIGMNVAVMFDKPIGNSPFSFGYGIGFFSHNFHSNTEFIYNKDSIGTGFTTSMEPLKRPYTVNRYAQKILEIPIEFRLRTKTDKQFKIHIGGKIGYVVNDFHTIKDNDGKTRVYNLKNINPLRYGVNFRIGFEQFAFTASYYFTEIFKKDKGVNGIIPYSIGIAIIPY
jgi:hypothetical protein